MTLGVMNKYADKIAITTGDPNGIGAEITIKALNLLNLPSKDIVIVSNSKVLNNYGSLENNYELIEIDYPEKIVPGEVSAAAGNFAYKALEKASNFCFIQSQTFPAISFTLVSFSFF